MVGATVVVVNERLVIVVETGVSVVILQPVKPNGLRLVKIVPFKHLPPMTKLSN